MMCRAYFLIYAPNTWRRLLSILWVCALREIMFSYCAAIWWLIISDLNFYEKQSDFMLMQASKCT